MSNPAIAVLGCRRRDMLERIVRSLSAMDSIADYSVYVSLGCPESITREDALSLFQRDSIPIPVTVLQFQDPQAHAQNPLRFLRIQQHYAFILSELFEHRHHSHVIILEDDLQLSPSLLDFFQQTASLFEEDPSIACVSAFNDNAYPFSLLVFRRLGETPDRLRLHRASSFPNLGLLFSARTYFLLWANQPLHVTTNGWDHWLRIRVRSLGMDCVFPSLPRVRHLESANSTTAHGVLGKKLAKYPMDEDGPVDLGDIRYVVKEAYERSIVEMVTEEVVEVAKNWDEELEGASLEYSAGKNVLVMLEKDDLRRTRIMNNRVIVVPFVREVPSGFVRDA